LVGAALAQDERIRLRRGELRPVSADIEELREQRGRKIEEANHLLTGRSDAPGHRLVF